MVSETGYYRARSFPHGTNNEMELRAIGAALEAFGDAPIVIESDSQYAINCVSEWGPSWIRRGITGKANQDLVCYIVRMLEDRPAGAAVQFTWVRGHQASNTHPLNTAADEIANGMAHAAQTGRAGTREGYHEIDWGPRPEPEGSGNRREWGNQTHLGKEFGLDAREVGRILTSAGLKNGPEATQVALDEGYARPLVMRDGTPIFQWHLSRTRSVIAQGRVPEAAGAQ